MTFVLSLIETIVYHTATAMTVYPVKSSPMEIESFCFLAVGHHCNYVFFRVVSFLFVIP